MHILILLSSYLGSLTYSFFDRYISFSFLIPITFEIIHTCVPIRPRLRCVHILRCMRQSEYSRTLCIWQVWCGTSFHQQLTSTRSLLMFCCQLFLGLPLLLTLVNVHCNTWVGRLGESCGMAEPT